MDKVKIPRNSECYTPLSESFKFYEILNFDFGENSFCDLVVYDAI
jgi:hypothetical protein